MTGASVKAIRLEKATAAEIVIASSRNTRPIKPSRKARDEKAAITTSVVATTANPTWRAPR